MKRKDKTDTGPACGNCALCIHTYKGCECGLTDKEVIDTQPACTDYIMEDGEL